MAERRRVQRRGGAHFLKILATCHNLHSAIPDVKDTSRRRNFILSLRREGGVLVYNSVNVLRVSLDL